MDEDEIRAALLLFPGARRGANGVILDYKGGSFYMTGMRPTDRDLTLEEQMFLQICSKNEVIRLRNIKTAHDYFLRFRANALMDSARLTRVFSARRKRFESNGRRWSLTDYYSTMNEVPKRYISRLPRQSRRICREIPFGFAPLPEANAV